MGLCFRRKVTFALLGGALGASVSGQSAETLALSVGVKPVAYPQTSRPAETNYSIDLPAASALARLPLRCLRTDTEQTRPCDERCRGGAHSARAAPEFLRLLRLAFGRARALDARQAFSACSLSCRRPAKFASCWSSTSRLGMCAPRSSTSINPIANPSSAPMAGRGC